MTRINTPFTIRLTLRRLALCSLGALLPPPLLSLLCRHTELWPGRCAGPATCDPPHQSRQNPINNKPGGEQGSRGAVLAVANYYWLSRPICRCPSATGAPSVPPTNRIQEMVNRVTVCLHADERASVPYPAEAIPSGSCVHRWDYVLLLSPGA
jgi:hypothetical protein